MVGSVPSGHVELESCHTGGADRTKAGTNDDSGEVAMSIYCLLSKETASFLFKIVSRGGGEPPRRQRHRRPRYSI